MTTQFQSPLLSYDQVRIIKDLITATRASGKSVLGTLGYRSVEDIPQSKFMQTAGILAKGLKNAARTA